ncbi:MAG TPA: caspase family protein [Verrucomicrobiae bacterium]|nr:caspase family protein [Verrucomicrobiae bacterium]
MITGDRKALIVATSEYSDPRLAPLDGPQKDAEALLAVLADTQVGGFDVDLALNESSAVLLETIDAFFQNRSRNDLLLLHFSGHGLKNDDGDLYLAATNTKLDRLSSKAIEASWLSRQMARSRSERVALFLDCCFAGAFTSGMTRRAGADTAGVNERFSGTGRFVITASDAMQYSLEGGTRVGEPPQPSPFTKALVEGLSTGAADRNEDGEVSIDELFDYLEERIRQTSTSQTPTKSAFNQVGDWMIARSTRAPSIGLLPMKLRLQLKSEQSLERLDTIIDLRRLAEGPDGPLSQGARLALRALVLDDSKTVARRAQEILDSLPGEGSGALLGGVTASGTTHLVDAGRQITDPGSPAQEHDAAPTHPTIIVGPSGAPTPVPSTMIEQSRRDARFAGAASPQEHPSPNPDLQAAATAAAAAFLAAKQAESRANARLMWRTFARAAIGTVIGSSAHQAISFVMSFTSSVSISQVLAQVIGCAIAAAVIETKIRFLRVPDGNFWVSVRHNRWVASAIAGASFGLFSPPDGIVGYAVGFVVGEAIFGRRFASKSVQASAAMEASNP